MNNISPCFFVLVLICFILILFCYFCFCIQFCFILLDFVSVISSPGLETVAFAMGLPDLLAGRILEVARGVWCHEAWKLAPLLRRVSPKTWNTYGYLPTVVAILIGKNSE